MLENGKQSFKPDRKRNVYAKKILQVFMQDSFFVTKLLVVGLYQEHTVLCFFNLAYPVHLFKRRRKRQF